MTDLFRPSTDHTGHPGAQQQMNTQTNKRDPRKHKLLDIYHTLYTMVWNNFCSQAQSHETIDLLGIKADLSNPDLRAGFIII